MIGLGAAVGGTMASILEAGSCTGSIDDDIDRGCGSVAVALFCQRLRSCFVVPGCAFSIVERSLGARFIFNKQFAAGFAEFIQNLLSNRSASLCCHALIFT